MTKPLVTCVMITGHQTSRQPLALRAVESFRRQIYPNRELLIVNQGKPFDLPDQNIRELRLVTGDRTLGDLRNIGLLAAKGDLVTAWDDDDFHGNRRLHTQVEHGWPCVLQNMILVNSLTGEAKAISAASWRQQGFPGTLLYSRRTHHRYLALARGEDNRFALNFRCHRPLTNLATDYIRFYHGDNTCPQLHYANLLTTCRELNDRELRTVHALQWWIGHTPRRCRGVADVKQTLGSLQGMSCQTAEFLDQLIRHQGLREVLETSHLHGVSTCYFAATGANVTTADLQHSRCNMPNVEDTLEACCLAATVIRKPCRPALLNWAIEGRQWDLIHLDGSRNVADVWCDVHIADRVLRVGGWLVISDDRRDGSAAMKQVWDRLPGNYDQQPKSQANCRVATKRN